MLGQVKYYSVFPSFIFVYKSFKLQVFVFVSYWIDCNGLRKHKLEKKEAIIKIRSGSGDF